MRILALFDDGNGFNTQPPEGGWFDTHQTILMMVLFQHTAARRRLDYVANQITSSVRVSTHSRPKAAGMTSQNTVITIRRFNTQPPEGGWEQNAANTGQNSGFNTQPPEGGWICSCRPIAY